jgi:cytidylate kinase
MGCNITIDGPAGAGKSTIAKLLAKQLGYIYVDTGAMYRALAVYFLEQGIDPSDSQKMIAACKDAKITIQYENQIQQVYLNGKNITKYLREERVGNMASVCATLPEVRQTLLELQRDLAQQQDVVMDGRDIGTHVLPHANVKFYLTASSHARAKRRYMELKEKGEQATLEAITDDIEKRDYRDKNRSISPLRPAEDAIYVDSSEMSIEQVTKEMMEHIQKKCPRNAR